MAVLTEPMPQTVPGPFRACKTCNSRPAVPSGAETSCADGCQWVPMGARHPSATVTNLHTGGSGGERRRLAAWLALGVLPAGLAPCSIAAAHARITGQPPARDARRRQSRAYSYAELARALAALGFQPLRQPPPPDPKHPALACVWGAVLDRVPLSSTRMLLSQQAALVELRSSGWGASRVVDAVVEVAPSWLAMVESRAVLIFEAVEAVLGGRVSLQLVAQEVGR